VLTLPLIPFSAIKNKAAKSQIITWAEKKMAKNSKLVRISRRIL
jgi:hypothetical protein